MAEIYKSKLGIPYDITYEIDGSGELGSISSFDVHGHIDFFDSELFIADVIDEWRGGEEAYLRGYDIEHLHRYELPFDDDDYNSEEIGERWTFHYAKKPGADTIPVTRFQDSFVWSDPEGNPRLCMSRKAHGEAVEIANQGVPIQMVSNPEDFPGNDGHIYLCREHADEFFKRHREAVDRETKKLREEQEAST